MLSFEFFLKETVMTHKNRNNVCRRCGRIILKGEVCYKKSAPARYVCEQCYEEMIFSSPIEEEMSISIRQILPDGRTIVITERV